VQDPLTPSIFTAVSPIPNSTRIFLACQ
jgi:hypothetical protein